MKPGAFDYLRADSVEEAVAALAEVGDEARIIAGGQSLAPMLNMRLVRPELLVDIARIGPLRGIAAADGAIEVGAAATQAELLAWPGLKDAAPLLALAMPWIGHMQTRNRGTVCGSIAHADPSAELPLCLMALGGEVCLRSAAGARRLSADDFLIAMLTTACEPDEMVEQVRFPVAAPGTGWAFREIAVRHGDFAIASFAAIAHADGLRLAVGGVGDRPLLLDLPDLDGDDLRGAVADFAAGIDARSDPQADADYRRDLVRRIGLRTLREARGEAREEARACRA